jgi:hypothetical protein
LVAFSRVSAISANAFAVRTDKERDLLLVGLVAGGSNEAPVAAGE